MCLNPEITNSVSASSIKSLVLKEGGVPTLDKCASKLRGAFYSSELRLSSGAGEGIQLKWPVLVSF